MSRFPLVHTPAQAAMLMRCLFASHSDITDGTNGRDQGDTLFTLNGSSRGAVGSANADQASRHSTASRHPTVAINDDISVT
jgi:hypothetical protein